MNEIPEEPDENFTGFAEASEQDLVRKRLEANAKSVARSRRIRWGLRYTIIVCGVIIALVVYFEPEGTLISGLVCFSIFFTLRLRGAVIFDGRTRARQHEAVFVEETTTTT